jgi:hypothetical protein
LVDQAAKTPNTMKRTLAIAAASAALGFIAAVLTLGRYQIINPGGALWIYRCDRLTGEVTYVGLNGSAVKLPAGRD